MPKPPGHPRLRCFHHGMDPAPLGPAFSFFGMKVGWELARPCGRPRETQPGSPWSVGGPSPWFPLPRPACVIRQRPWKGHETPPPRRLASCVVFGITDRRLCGSPCVNQALSSGVRSQRGPSIRTLPTHGSGAGVCPSTKLGISTSDATLAVMKWNLEAVLAVYPTQGWKHRRYEVEEEHHLVMLDSYRKHRVLVC